MCATQKREKPSRAFTWATAVWAALVATGLTDSAGASVVVMASGTSERLTGIWGSSPNDAWAVGTNNTLLHLVGEKWGSWSGHPSGSPYATPFHYNAIWGSGANDIFIVADGGTILHYDGTGWKGMVSGTTEDVYAVWGSGPNDVYAVGADGKHMLHYDGTAWSAQLVPGEHFELTGVWGSGANDVFVLATPPAILHSNLWWGEMSIPSTLGFPLLSAVWGSGPGDVFAVGTSSVTPQGLSVLSLILHYDGTNWSTLYSPFTTSDLHAVWGTSASNVYAVGDGGTLIRYDGSKWLPTMKATSKALYAVWGTGPHSFFAVGESGTILHYVELAVEPLPAYPWAVMVDLSQIQQLGSVSIDYGEEYVTLTPIPEEGARFSHWEGDVPDGQEYDDPLNLMLSEDVSLTAVFVEEDAVSNGDTDGWVDPLPILEGCGLGVLFAAPLTLLGLVGLRAVYGTTCP